MLNTLQFRTRSRILLRLVGHEQFAFQNNYELLFSQKYDSFQRKDVKLQEDMKHSKTQIKKHQVCVLAVEYCMAD